MLKRLKLDFGINRHNLNSFKTIYLTPSLYMIKDKQFEENFQTEFREVKGSIEYSFGIDWLIWGFWVAIEIENK
jgi:hypothetical protein